MKRAFSPSLDGVSWAGRIMYGVILGIGMVLVLYGVQRGPLVLSLAALVLMVPFVFAAPFVFGARWKTPERRPTRRPVVRRRRH